jgi:hypothetical protein
MGAGGGSGGDTMMGGSALGTSVGTNHDASPQRTQWGALAEHRAPQGWQIFMVCWGCSGYGGGMSNLIVAEIRRAREVLHQACINAAMVEADVMEEADMTCGCRIANHIRSVIGDIRKLP